MTNLTVQLPHGPWLVVRQYAPHPCGGWWLLDATVKLPGGLRARYLDPTASAAKR